MTMQRPDPAPLRSDWIDLTYTDICHYTEEVVLSGLWRRHAGKPTGQIGTKCGRNKRLDARGYYVCPVHDGLPGAVTA